MQRYYCRTKLNTLSPVIRSAAVIVALVGATPALAALSPDDFVTTWKTDNPGTSDATSITVPMGGSYDVDWDNDGAFDETGLNGPVTHDFGVAGTYTIRISASYSSFSFGVASDSEKILSVDQWGTTQWYSMNSAFFGAVNLTVPATDTPDFSAVTSMFRMFQDAPLANPDTSGWDTSSVTDMSAMFFNASAANPDTSGWDTSKVTNMSSMFGGAAAANPDTSGWDTSLVTNMAGMFSNATSATPDTSGWITSAVTDMSSMFFGATAANPDVSAWVTSSVTTMATMFSGATSANPDVSSWDTSSVTSMLRTFYGATSANPDVSGWNTGAVTTMNSMFRNATAFNRDIGSWDVSAVNDATNMLVGVTLSSANYDSLLVGWDAQTLHTAVSFHGGNSTYCSQEAADARVDMTSTYSWTITDGGQHCPATCNVTTVSGVTDATDAEHEACEILSIGPDYTANNNADITLSSGWEVEFENNFNLVPGASMNANICGQSLCQTSASPMPYGCHSCVTEICDLDPSCCDTTFDQSCVDRVYTVCNLACE